MNPVWYYATILFLGAGVMVAIGLTALLRRRTAMSGYFVAFCLTVAVYSLGYGMEVTRTSSEAILFWSRFQYLGLPFISSFLILFIIHFVSSGRRVSPVIPVVLLLFSSVVLVIRQTNSRHHLYYRSLDFIEVSGQLFMAMDKGPWYWIWAAYNVLCIAGSAVMIGIYMSDAPAVYRRQASWLLAGTFIPLTPYVAHISGLVPLDIDIIPASIVVASFALYRAMSHHELFSLVPVGRDRLIEIMTEAVLVLDLQNRVADVNPAARQAFGSDGPDPVGRQLEDACPQLSRVGEDSRLVTGNDGIWEVTRVRLDTGKATEGYLLVGHDVSEREALLARLEKVAREDALTGLLNRHSWDEAVKTELTRLSRHGRFGSIIYVDLDGFKDVNDTHGHSAGDEVLRTVGRVLLEGVRRPDLVGRYGGEEFVLFLPEIHPEAAVDVAERLRVDLYESVEADMTVNIRVTGSFGVAGGIITDDVTLEDLIARADRAMYESKKTGKNRVSWNRN